MINKTTDTKLFSVNICINRNRVKIYPNLPDGHRKDAVFLKDKQEFQIEIFNGNSEKMLAKIFINGKAISKSGIVLRPGQRTYLERFLDDAKKFVFETYNMDKTKEVLLAIQNNGDVEVRFYSEESIKEKDELDEKWKKTIEDKIKEGIDREKKTEIHHYHYQPYQYPYKPYDVLYHNETSNTTGENHLLNGTITSSNCYYNSVKPTNISSCTTTSTSLSSSLNGIPEIIFKQSLRKSEISLDGMMETGTIEKGGYSNQKFQDDYSKFKTLVTEIVYIKILPLSNKPIEGKDLIEYCTECGTKLKKEWKHCPSCGHKK